MENRNEQIASLMVATAKIGRMVQDLNEQKTKMDPLQAKMVEMFSRPNPVNVEKVGDDLYILDRIYDVWPEDEDKGKSAKLIQEIVYGKIRDYSRIHDEYEYKNSNYQYFPQGEMRFIFHFQKPTEY